MRQLKVKVDASRSVHGLGLEPNGPIEAILVLGHGAGAGMSHPFMAALAKALAARNIATLRYQFPYMEAGLKRPDPEPILKATVRAALAQAMHEYPDLPLFVGGKSMGGRMSSLALAELSEEAVRALVFFGFPLHPANRPGISRAEHLNKVNKPMLFLQGTRDKLSEASLMRGVARKLGAKAVLCEIDGADHGFAVLKSSGRTSSDVLAEVADLAAGFMREHAKS